MINVHDKWFAYHGDIIHYLSVDLYSTEPPEIPSEMAGYFVYKGFMPFDICTRYPNRYPF